MQNDSNTVDRAFDRNRFDQLLTVEQAAQRLQLASGTLANWRSQGKGPAYVKLGSRIRYLEANLSEFIERGAV